MKFRKRPIVVEAEQFYIDKTPWPKGVQSYLVPNGPEWGYNPSSHTRVCYITTLEGDMLIKEGDWIITGIKGEVYPCKPDIFEATYEVVE